MIESQTGLSDATGRLGVHTVQSPGPATPELGDKRKVLSTGYSPGKDARTFSRTADIIAETLAKVSIIRDTPRKELAEELVRYLTGVEGQTRLMTKSSYMAAGPNQAAWDQLIQTNPKEAKMVHVMEGDDNIINLLRDGKIIPRRLPKVQSMETWQDAYTQFQNL